MSDLDDIYGNRILELAAAIPGTEPLANPDATASAHSKLCGSTVSVAIQMANGVVTGFSQNVKACLLGQASASVVGREIIGTTPDELRDVAETMRKMLKEDGPKPEGRWADLGVLQPVKDYKARHTSTLLIFDALDKAFRQIAAHQDDTTAYAEAG
ncbi:MAG: iron-sulfur cluster assembly scaffold protein [Pseudomonadota bacterium]